MLSLSNFLLRDQPSPKKNIFFNSYFIEWVDFARPLGVKKNHEKYAWLDV